MPETITFHEPGTNDYLDVDLIGEEFEDGPNGVGGYDNMGDVGRRQAWQDWLGANGRLELAKARVEAAVQQQDSLVASRHYDSTDIMNEVRAKKLALREQYGDIPRVDATQTILVFYEDGTSNELQISKLSIEIGLDSVVGRLAGKVPLLTYMEFAYEDKLEATYRILSDNRGAAADYIVQVLSKTPPTSFALRSCCMAAGTADIVGPVAGFFIYGACAVGLGKGIHRAVNRPHCPVNLTVKPFFDVDVQQFVLTANWEAPAEDTGDPSRNAARYLVRLIVVGGTEKDPEAACSTSWISPMVEFGKTYKIGVRSQARDGDTSSEVVSDEITIPSMIPQPQTGTPIEPPAVTLSQVLLGNGAATLKVVWSAPATSAPEKYEVVLSNTNGYEDKRDVPSTMVPLEWIYEGGLISGTYTASVTSLIGAAKSNATKSASVVFSTTPSGPPNAPIKLDIELSVAADSSPQTVVDLTWRPASDGPPTNSYTVTRSQGGMAIERYTILMQEFTFAPVDDGTYTYSVVAQNSEGDSAALKEEIDVTFQNVDPTIINWETLIAAADKTAWKTQILTMNNMAQQDFWDKAVATVSTGDNGGAASFENQLALATLYRELIAEPANDPTAGQVERMAEALSAQHTPMVGTPDFEWWTHAGSLANFMSAIFSVRWQLAGLMRALEDLLGREHSIK